MTKNDVAKFSEKSYVHHLPKTQNTNNATNTLQEIGLISFAFLMFTFLVLAVASSMMNLVPAKAALWYNVGTILLTTGVAGTLVYFVRKFQWQTENPPALPNETPRKFLSSTVSQGIRIR
ncbi:MAG: hypothetical protein WC471_03770 [Candidatus Woesearchaeota archaeon]